MLSDTFRKIIENATGKTLEQVQNTPLSVAWKEVEDSMTPKELADWKKRANERIRQIGWRY